MTRNGGYPTPAAPARPFWAVGVPLGLMTTSLSTAAHASPASVQFYLATACSAAALVGAWWLFGDRRLVQGRRSVVPAFRHAAQGVGLGAALGLVFALGALVMVRIPALAAPVDALLANAAGAALLPTLMTTWINGAAEELFFRNTVVRHLAGLGRWAIPTAVGLYVVGTLPMQVPVLALAAVAVGVLAHAEVRRTGGVVSAMTMHLTWSTLMVVLLPAVV
ncbi:CPBP family glutamic-type intramembrane protease [Corynebacterium uterequi]|uniref:CAAX protease self-immunity n=1 Tax=Corynebacterium uterequi TaxID=1072256 RepID=A0A0G3HCE5_9CORY|nr:CPBP family glutamic-type intramembrane protease [Corynebacterium uterequi]AKK10365.1 CAAX protease self-immunity [Corynebacterium uterequi]